MNFTILKKIATLCFLLCISNGHAQFFKRLKEKIKQKVEQVVDKNIDKQVNKIDDVSIKKSKKSSRSKTSESSTNRTTAYNKNVEQKSTGKIKISHPDGKEITIQEFWNVSISRDGSKINIHGNWATTGVDVFDGFNIQLVNTGFDNTKDISDFPKGKYQILFNPDLKLATNQHLKARFNTAYNIKESSNSESNKKSYPYNYHMQSGYIELLNLDKNTIEFDLAGTTKSGFEGMETLPSVTIKGAVLNNIKIKKPSLTKKRDYNSSSIQNSSTKSTTSSSKKLTDKRYSFDTKVVYIVKNKSQSDEMEISYLFNSSSDYYAVEYDLIQQGVTTFMVVDGDTFISLMDTGGFKIKQHTQQLSGDMAKNPSQDFELNNTLKLTGKTKSIAGYVASEYIASDEENEIVLWVTNQLKVKNPFMKSAKMKGLLLEMTTKKQDAFMKAKEIDTNYSLSLDTSDYSSMGSMRMSELEKLGNQIN